LVDTNSKCLGVFLLQDGCPIAYVSSKTLTDRQQNYTQVAKEILAVVFGFTWFHEHIYGIPTAILHVEVKTDHKPSLKATAPGLFFQIMTIQKCSINNLVYHSGEQLHTRTV